MPIFGFAGIKKNSCKITRKFGEKKIGSTFALPIRGSIAQLVQSICLTSRGSGVRIPLLPQKLKPHLAAFFMAWCYILFSQSLDRFYVGSTELLPEERLKKHLNNHSGFTAKAKDWTIVFREEFQTITQARSREVQFKKWKSKTMIQKLIESQSD